VSEYGAMTQWQEKHSIRTCKVMTPALLHGTAQRERRRRRGGRRVVWNQHSMHKDDWRAGARCRLESKIGANYMKIHFVKNKAAVLQVCATVCIAMLRNVGTVTATTHSDISEDLHLQQCCQTDQIYRGTYLATCPVVINMRDDSTVRVSGFKTHTFKFL
jgi:hypothetical protein